MVFSSFDINVYFTCIATSQKKDKLTASCLGSCSAMVLNREAVGFLAANRMSWTSRSAAQEETFSQDSHTHDSFENTSLRLRPVQEEVNLNFALLFDSINTKLAGKSPHCLSVASLSSSAAHASFSSSESDTSLRARSECDTICWTAWSSSSTG